MYFRSLRKSAQDVSLSDNIETGADGSPLSLMDVISEEGDLLDRVTGQEQVAALRKAVSTRLSDQEREVIMLRYGLRDGISRRQREVAMLIGISRSYVSRIEKRALEKLREVIDN